MRAISIAIALLSALPTAQKANAAGPGDSFRRLWTIESESPDYRVSLLGDTVEVAAPKGLTLWYNRRMRAPAQVEYDACIVQEGPGDRLSDLNCFWMASDPACPSDIMKRAKWRGGVFERCYSLRLYYLGYGGNHNTTTRFRRYTGDEATVSDTALRPKVLREYTDTAHLLRPNHWYHIRITCDGDRTCYYIDGERLVDFREADPLQEGWFALRTTAARLRFANFRCEALPKDDTALSLHWIGDTPQEDTGVTLGVPYDPGEMTEDTPTLLTTPAGQALAHDSWTLAYWPDGSVKWQAIATVAPAGSDSLILAKANARQPKNTGGPRLEVTETEAGITVNTGPITASIPRQGRCLVDSITMDGTAMATNIRLACSTQSEPMSEGTTSIEITNYSMRLAAADVERRGDTRAVVRLSGTHQGPRGREWLPFTVRLYFYAGRERVDMTHTIVFDGDQDTDFIRSLLVAADVPMRQETYNRHVAFACADGGVWSEPVQPLVGRRTLAPPEGDLRTETMQERQMEGETIPPRGQFDEKGKSLLDSWAAWDEFRLSQLSADAFSIRKRTRPDRPWVGTLSGTRSGGVAFAGDTRGGLAMALHDFWQSYPSTLYIYRARADTATLALFLWSEESEPMDLRHYDTTPHGLEASYEDVQEGMSSPLGIARTTSIALQPVRGYRGKASFARMAKALAAAPRILPTPKYLHDRRAFGTWSLPDRSNPARAAVEDRLKDYTDFYQTAVEQHKWYGFWNYGDVMHSYDTTRHSWRYDVGGYAWDNTELASNLWLWYSFLRTADPNLWRMAEAMTRHTCEVDVYHLGPNAGLGSRHNVSHWGCGAKEARISQATWNRFYHYLTADERAGDLMDEVADADTLLYRLDPMRLAEPRELYPCTAPARLRIGPDWLAYAANWLTKWERTRDLRYRDKILAGMRSISSLPNRIFTGPLALGYDPATGVITTECDPDMQQTNHLMSIMGGFEMMNEMMRSLPDKDWADTWLEYARDYKRKALEINHNRFRVSRLLAYAAYNLRDTALAAEAWHDLFHQLETEPAPPFRLYDVAPPLVPYTIRECTPISTNDAAIWSLDAIYMQEVIPINQ